MNGFNIKKLRLCLLSRRSESYRNIFKEIFSFALILKHEKIKIYRAYIVYFWLQNIPAKCVCTFFIVFVKGCIRKV